MMTYDDRINLKSEKILSFHGRSKRIRHVSSCLHRHFSNGSHVIESRIKQRQEEKICVVQEKHYYKSFGKREDCFYQENTKYQKLGMK